MHQRFGLDYSCNIHFSSLVPCLPKVFSVTSGKTQNLPHPCCIQCSVSLAAPIPPTVHHHVLAFPGNDRTSSCAQPHPASPSASTTQLKPHYSRGKISLHPHTLWDHDPNLHSWKRASGYSQNLTEGLCEIHILNFCLKPLFLRIRGKAMETDWQRKSPRKMKCFSLNSFPLPLFLSLSSTFPPGVPLQAQWIKGFCFTVKLSVQFGSEHKSVIQSLVPTLMTLRSHCSSEWHTS